LQTQCAAEAKFLEDEPLKSAQPRNNKKKAVFRQREFLFLKKMREGKLVEVPFDCYNESIIFKGKKASMLMNTELPDNSGDDDVQTELDVVKDSKASCMRDLREAIKKFASEDPLKSIRNIRNEFSGLTKAESDES
jgi:hypothetical protein